MRELSAHSIGRISHHMLGFARGLKCHRVEREEKAFKSLKLTSQLPTVEEWRPSMRATSAEPTYATGVEHAQPSIGFPHHMDLSAWVFHSPRVHREGYTLNHLKLTSWRSTSPEIWSRDDPSSPRPCEA